MNGIPYPLVVVDGAARRTWRPYAIDFESPDGRFSVHLYAISAMHAQLQLEALRETGKVTGVVVGVIPARG